MLTAPKALELSARLKSGDPETVWKAALETLDKAEMNDLTRRMVGMAAYYARKDPQRSFVKFAEAHKARGGSLSRPSLLNYAEAYALASLVTEPGSEISAVHMKDACRAINATKSTARANMVEHVTELSMADRVGFFEDLADDEFVKGLEAIFGDAPKPPVEGKVVVLEGIAKQIAEGKFTLADAVRLAEAAKLIIDAATAQATSATLAAEARELVNA